MGKPSRLSKQGKTLTLQAVSRNNHVIPSTLGCSHCFNSFQKRIPAQDGKEQSRSQTSHQQCTIFPGGEAETSYIISQGEWQEKEHWVFDEGIRACVSPLGPHMMLRHHQAKSCDGQAGQSKQHLPLEITRSCLLLLQKAFVLCSGSSSMFAHVK